MTRKRPRVLQVIDLVVEVAGIEPADGQIRTHDAEAGFVMIPDQFVMVRYGSSPFAPFMPHQKKRLTLGDNRL